MICSASSPRLRSQLNVSVVGQIFAHRSVSGAIGRDSARRRPILEEVQVGSIATWGPALLTFCIVSAGGTARGDALRDPHAQLLAGKGA